MAFHGSNGVRAWINFKGNGTHSIRDSFNMASYNDNGNGDYRFNFSTSFPSDGFCAVASVTYLIAQVRRHRIVSPYQWSTSYIRVVSGYNDTTAQDHEVISVMCSDSN